MYQGAGIWMVRVQVEDFYFAFLAALHIACVIHCAELVLIPKGAFLIEVDLEVAEEIRGLGLG